MGNPDFMKNKSFTITNAKSFREQAPISFADDLNILIGLNAGGKSNALDLLTWALRSHFIGRAKLESGGPQPRIENEPGFDSMQSGPDKHVRGTGLPIAPHLPRGSEIWVRLYVYWPADFKFSATPFMNRMRLHNRTGDGKHGGYNDIYIHKADQKTSVIRIIKEVHDRWQIYDGDWQPRGSSVQ